MSAMRKKWKQDKGSIDLIQLFVGMLIISIAAVGTTKAFYWGYGQLEYQFRYRKAVSMARSYVEYWQGRVHTDLDFGDRRTMSGNLGSPQTFLLDERDPTTVMDDIYCEVAYGPIFAVDLDETEGTDYFDLNVIVSWSEPNDIVMRHEIVLNAAMVPAAL